VRHWKVWHSKHTGPGAYGGSASQAARFRTRMQVDAFLKEHEVYDLTWRISSRTGRHSASSEREKLSFEPALDMVVVADTSPINYLVLIEQIDLLTRLYTRILIPPAVLAELKHPLAPKPVATGPAIRLNGWKFLARKTA